MKTTNKATEQAAYNVVRTHHITKINVRPNQAQLIRTENEIAAKLVNIDISDTYGDMTIDTTNMNNFGCLGRLYDENKDIASYKARRVCEVTGLPYVIRGTWLVGHHSRSSLSGLRI